MRAQLFLAVAFLAACGDVNGGDEDGGVFSRDATEVVRRDSGQPPSSGILVDAVFDGDTMSVRASSSHKAPDGIPLADRNIRFLGIDAPEIAHPPNAADCWGDEAAVYARNLLAGQFVTLEYDETHELRDQFGRLLAYIRLSDDRVANEVLLSEGMARSFRAFPHKNTTEYNALEREARDANRGLWTCQ